MSDTVEFGGWPRPPRWVWVIAGVAAVAVLVGLVVAHTGRHRAAPASAVTSPATPGNGGLQMLPKPARMAGRPVPRDAGLRLVLGGRRPAWLWVSTGRTAPIRGLPRPDNGYQLFRVAGGWAALPWPGYDTSCPNCAPRPMPVYYVADGSREASRLGTADFVAPAANTDALWLVSYRAGALMPTTAGIAQEVSVSGAALGPRRGWEGGGGAVARGGKRISLPAGWVIDQGTSSGLLLAPEVTRASVVRYQLWAPATRRVSHSFPNVIAVSAGEIAWAPACTPRCAVRVLSLNGGPGRVIPLAGRIQAYAGAFSPDGRLLALQVATGVVAHGRATASRLVVADVASGRLTAVPGTTVGSGISVAFDWQGGGDQLVAGVGRHGGWQVAVWRPRDAHLYVASPRAPAGSWPVIGPGPY